MITGHSMSIMIPKIFMKLRIYQINNLAPWLEFSLKKP